jgi:hypothetical protein
MRAAIVKKLNGIQFRGMATITNGKPSPTHAGRRRSELEAEVELIAARRARQRKPPVENSALYSLLVRFIEGAEGGARTTRERAV